MKNTMTKMMVLAAALTLSCFAHAADANGADADLFDAALEMGANVENGMSKTYVSIGNVSCQYTVATQESECSAHDNQAEDESKAELTVTGKSAERVMAALSKAGAQSDNGMGHMWIGVEGFSCRQSSGAVNDDGQPHTFCDVSFEAQ